VRSTPRSRFGLFEHVKTGIKRRLVLPRRIDRWSLTSLQQRVVKTGGRSRYYWLPLAEGGLMRRLFGVMVRKLPAS
jgi:hypothetical protein